MDTFTVDTRKFIQQIGVLAITASKDGKKGGPLSSVILAPATGGSPAGADEPGTTNKVLAGYSTNGGVRAHFAIPYSGNLTEPILIPLDWASAITSTWLAATRTLDKDAPHHLLCTVDHSRETLQTRPSDDEDSPNVNKASLGIARKYPLLDVASIIAASSRTTTIQDKDGFELPAGRMLSPAPAHSALLNSVSRRLGAAPRYYPLGHPAGLLTVTIGDSWRGTIQSDKWAANADVNDPEVEAATLVLPEGYTDDIGETPEVDAKTKAAA